MKRILFVVSGAMVLGGTETMLMNWYRNFDKNLLQVDFVCYGNKEGAYDEEIKKLGGKIYRLPSKRENLIKNLTGIYKICKENKYEIIHVHMDAMSFYPILMAKLAGVKTRICHCHSTNHLYTSQINLWLKNLLTRLLPFVATDLFACSEASGKWLYRNKDFTVFHNAIQLERFEYSPEKEKRVRDDLGIAGKLVIGNVGNMNYPKNHIFMIDVFSEVKKIQDNAVLLLIGDGPDREIVEKKIQDLCIEKDVLLLGQRNDVNDIIQSFDVFILTSIFEGFPVVLVEAQAAGIPCVISDSITEEVKITNLIETVSLKEEANIWAKCVLGQARRGKSCTNDLIINNGFDIAQESKKLESFYLSRLDA